MFRRIISRYSSSKSPSMTARQSWIAARFGNLRNTKLGDISTVPTVHFPELVQEHDIKSHGKIKICKVDVQKYHEDIARLYQDGIDEMKGNGEYEWHHDPNKIQDHVATGDWAFYGVFWQEKLIAVESMFIIRGQRAIQWVWGVSDPRERGKGMFVKIGEFNDALIEQSGAQMGIVWVATTHDLSQRNVEAVGYNPIGCFIGGEFLGGSDGKFYRQNVIWYNKIYGEGRNFVQSRKDMILTPKAEALVNTVMEIAQRKEL